MQRHTDVTTVFIKMPSITRKSEPISLHQKIETLHMIFSELDSLVESHGVERVKTIGKDPLSLSALLSSSSVCVCVSFFFVILLILFPLPSDFPSFFRFRISRSMWHASPNSQ